MVDWPITLPTNPLSDGYSETLDDNTIRTKMETGPDKIRRRSTASSRKIGVAYLLSKTQTATLDDFYLNTLESGSLGFNYTHPRTGVLETARFISVPEYRSQNGEYFRVALQLEILP